MRLRLRSAAGGILAALAVVACASPAQATVINRQHVEFSESYDMVVCGVLVRGDHLITGDAHLRVGKGDLDTLYMDFVNYHDTDILTNEANGNFVRIEHKAVFVDVNATRVEGSVFEVTSVRAGQPLTLYDMNGRVVSRERGVIRETYLFDTGGDHTPGGTYLGLLSVRASGPHPLLPGGGVFNEDAFCEIARPLLLS